MIYSKKNVMAIHEDSSKWGFGDGVSRWVCTGISIFRQREREISSKTLTKGVSSGGVNVFVHTTLAADTWSKPL